MFSGYEIGQIKVLNWAKLGIKLGTFVYEIGNENLRKNECCVPLFVKLCHKLCNYATKLKNLWMFWTEIVNECPKIWAVFLCYNMVEGYKDWARVGKN